MDRPQTSAKKKIKWRRNGEGEIDQCSRPSRFLVAFTLSLPPAPPSPPPLPSLSLWLSPKSLFDAYYGVVRWSSLLPRHPWPLSKKLRLFYNAHNTWAWHYGSTDQTSQRHLSSLVGLSACSLISFLSGPLSSIHHLAPPLSSSFLGRPAHFLFFRCVLDAMFSWVFCLYCLYPTFF